jgi:UDP-N-acetylglucosamine/UDP-N-acetylgalactosamine diphosphorylase
MDSEGKEITGPDGNGGVFRKLVESGILKKWEIEGVRAISVIMVDNPLLDPFCPALLTPIFEGIDLTAGAIERVSSDEQVGVFIEEDGQIRVVEYTELPSSLRDQKDPEGHLLFRWANISAFGCSVEFIRRAAVLPLPLHAAKKTVNGQKVWKGEYFIFDAMPAARTIAIIPLDRKNSFAPVKDPASLKAAQVAFQEKERLRYIEMTGLPPERPVELPATAWYQPLQG